MSNLNTSLNQLESFYAPFNIIPCDESNIFIYRETNYPAARLDSSFAFAAIYSSPRTPEDLFRSSGWTFNARVTEFSVIVSIGELKLEPVSRPPRFGRIARAGVYDFVD